MNNIIEICCFFVLASHAYSRSVPGIPAHFFGRNSNVDLYADASDIKIDPLAEGRVFPGSLVAKKLLLLKFKKLLPIKLLLLKSQNGGEDEYIPLFDSNLIPSDIDVINTPGGLTGHEDVYAVGIPSDLDNKYDIPLALQVVASSKAPHYDAILAEEDQPLDVTDEYGNDQFLLDAVHTPAFGSMFNLKEKSRHHQYRNEYHK